MTTTRHKERKLHRTRYGFENLLVWLFPYRVVVARLVGIQAARERTRDN